MQGAVLTQYATARLEEKLTRIPSYTITQLADDKYWVCHNSRNATASGRLSSGLAQDGRMVHLAEQYCDCRLLNGQTRLRLEPCVHELCVINFRGKGSVLDDSCVDKFFHRAFFNDNLLKGLSMEMDPCLGCQLREETMFVSPAVDLLAKQARKRKASGRCIQHHILLYISYIHNYSLYGFVFWLLLGDRQVRNTEVAELVRTTLRNATWTVRYALWHLQRMRPHEGTMPLGKRQYHRRDGGNGHTDKGRRLSCQRTARSKAPPRLFCRRFCVAIK